MQFTHIHLSLDQQQEVFYMGNPIDSIYIYIYTMAFVTPDVEH